MKEEKKKETKEVIKSKDLKCKHIGVISVCNVPVDVYLVDWKFNGGHEHGHIIPAANKIYISREQSPQHMLVTLVHEMMHKISNEYQIHHIIANASSLWQVDEHIIEAYDQPIVMNLLLSEVNSEMFNRILGGEFHQET